MEDGNKISMKDITVYHWKTPEEGKAQYPKFVKDFQSTLKAMRIVVEPGGIERFLGDAPGPRPRDAADRAEWIHKCDQYQKKKDKIEDYCTTALGVLEKSFDYGTTPWNIVDKAASKPANVIDRDWTYRRRIEACWQALKNEYQPSTSVDLRQLKDQINKLDDSGPGGFETFQSEFHRLHAEIMATGVADAVTERELNGIVRDGIKNPFIWINVAYNLYKDNDNAPWRATFAAVSTALTSFRQKGFDPYAEAKSGPTPNVNTITANVANTAPAKTSHPNKKRSGNFHRDGSGKFSKQAKTTPTFTPNHADTSSNVNTNFNPPSTPSTPGESPNRCTRCWQPNSHSYKICSEVKCSCGHTLNPGQVICLNYDNHPPTMRFLRKMPRFMETALQALKKTRMPTTRKMPTPDPSRRNRNDSSRKVSVMTAQSSEEIHSAPSGESLDQWD